MYLYYGPEGAVRKQEGFVFLPPPLGELEVLRLGESTRHCLSLPVCTGVTLSWRRISTQELRCCQLS